MKLYMDLGNVIAGVPSPAGAVYEFVEDTIEPLFLGSNLQSVEGDLIVQGGTDLGGQVGFIMGGASRRRLALKPSDLSSDAEGICGKELSFGAARESAIVMGRAQTGHNRPFAAAWSAWGTFCPRFKSGVLLSVSAWRSQPRVDAAGAERPYRNETLRTGLLGRGHSECHPGVGSNMTLSVVSGLMRGTSRKRGSRPMATRWRTI